MATVVLTVSLSSSLQICLGDVMMNRVVDEVAHPAARGSQGHPFQCMAVAGHFSHLPLCDGPSLFRAVPVLILRDNG